MRDAMARRDGALVRDILFTLTTTESSSGRRRQIAAEADIRPDLGVSHPRRLPRRPAP